MHMVRGCTLASITKPVVMIMRRNDQYHCRHQEIHFMLMIILLQDQEDKTQREQQHRHKGPVMALVTMKQGIGAYGKCDPDHDPFKQQVMNDIDPKQRQAGQYKWKQRTMDCTGKRCGNTQSVPVYLKTHSANLQIFAMMLQVFCHPERYPLFRSTFAK